MKPPQFSLSDLAWTVGLLAMGFGGIAAGMSPWPDPNPNLATMAIKLALMIQTPISFCAGLGALFRAKGIGASIGGVALALICVVMTWGRGP